MDPDLLKNWQAEEQAALSRRRLDVKVMDIYEVQSKKREC